MRRLVKFLTAVVVTFGAISCVSLGSAVAGVSLPSAARAVLQSVSSGTVRGGHVTFLADGQSVAANQPATVTLHFQVQPGFHINSHTPKSDMLIPTRLTVAMVTGDPEVTAVDFPVGTPFTFAFEPKQKLDVYQGDVVLTAHLKAAPGQHILKAELAYQACDQAACYPPKKLPLEQPFTAK